MCAMMSSLNTTSYHNHFLDSSDMSRPQTSSSASSFPRREDNSTTSEADSCTMSLPNYVEDDDKGDYWGASGAPVKAAGDVSLSGKQLMPFLFKASLKLSSVKAEGVQKRLRQLEQLIDEERLSEFLIKRLNFVVDALDRENYVDAWEHFEILKTSFPEETSLHWALGLSLMIRELIPLQRRTRVGSAGVHLRNQ